MNVIFWVILLAVVADFAIGLVSTILNVRSLKSHPPVGLEDIYDNEEYHRSQQYIREHSRFGLAASLFKVGALLIFWITGGFNYLDQVIRLMEWGDVWNGVAFIGILAVFSMGIYRMLPLTAVAST